jgi:hypothetical protein
MPASAPLQHMIRLLSNPPDFGAIEDRDCWESIKNNAGRYGLAQLVAHAARHRLPGPERLWCDKVLTRSWNRHTENLSQLEYVLALFEREGVRAIALKGPCLALRCYQPPFLRKPSVDLDFAVREVDFPRACEALRREGYTQQTQVEEALAFSHHVVLLHPVRPRIELHFRLSHGAFGIPVDEFLDRAVAYRLPSGREAWILAPADEILHLALHVVCGRFAPFFHLYELRRICAVAPREHLEEALRRAEQDHFVGAFRMIDVAFRSHWGEPFLPAGMTLPRTWLHWRLNEELYFSFDQWSDLNGEHTLASRLRGRWLDIQTTDSPAQALRQFVLLGRHALRQIGRRGWRNLPVGGVPRARVGATGNSE